MIWIQVKHNSRVKSNLSYDCKTIIKQIAIIAFLVSLWKAQTTIMEWCHRQLYNCRTKLRMWTMILQQTCCTHYYLLFIIIWDFSKCVVYTVTYYYHMTWDKFTWETLTNVLCLRLWREFYKFTQEIYKIKFL